MPRLRRRGYRRRSASRDPIRRDSGHRRSLRRGTDARIGVLWHDASMASGLRSVLWRGVDPFSAELCHLARGDGTWDLHGVVLADLAAGGTEIRYRLRVDELWRSHRLRIEMTGAYASTLDLVGDGRGSWSVDGEREPALDGCIDVDVGVSPSTNTLPIRRLAPSIGETVATTVAWVRFPELTVEPDQQSYERLDEHRWIFRSEGFEAELEVDEDGLVVRYGELWTRAVATGDG
jgi:uncharacterized protein